MSTMAACRSLPSRTPLCLALGLIGSTAWAQTTPTEPARVVTVTGQALTAPSTGVAGFGDVPAARAPFQTAGYSQATLQDAGITALNELTRLDPGLGDAYNSAGYWASFSLRGYALDNRFNYRRDGLPINAETAISLDNKERVDLLRGTSGIQAGTSAPGGLVDFVVKRPRGDQKTFFVGYTQRGSLKAAADIDQTLGSQGQAGLRLNASVEKLDPALRDAQGHRHLLAAAGTLRVSPETLLEAEVELSHQSQPSQPGFSLLGGVLPQAGSINPRINLNNQRWSLPVVFDGSTASLRWTQQLDRDWRLQTQAMVQRLTNNDRAAFPFGCGIALPSSYCSDGSFDLYDYRSEHEHRTSRAVSSELQGKAQWGGMAHELALGVLWDDYHGRFGPQAFNQVEGRGLMDGSVQLPANPDASGANTNRTERSLEWSLRDVVTLAEPTRLWLGLRHTTLHRDTVRIDGSEATASTQAFTTPWLALSQQLTPALMAYASWGQGAESSVVPNLPTYSNAGQGRTQKSRQSELGLKYADNTWAWSLTGFDIHRPATRDVGDCNSSCTQVQDGNDHHRGLEASLSGHWDAWTLDTGAMWLRARREGSSDAGLNERTPTNVPRQTLRAALDYAVPAWPGLSLQASVQHQGQREVLADNSLQLPSWTTWGLATRYQWHGARTHYTLRAGVDNLFDVRAWKESPTQYDHVYLYPVDPRTFRISLQARL
ncbi:TonB-dependent siderophore receptor [Ideonella sp. B7]|nr:TonB-dependent siderophore receptor [Ideonella benzenivorans]